MEDKKVPEVASFLIRFVQDQSQPDGEPRYRGVVQHIQTNEQVLFTHWAEVEAFIQQLIPLERIKTEKGVDDEIEG